MTEARALDSRLTLAQALGLRACLAGPGSDADATEAGAVFAQLGILDTRQLLDPNWVTAGATNTAGFRSVSTPTPLGT